jgi:tRNA pseudouridine-54 N-methylase
MDDNVRFLLGGKDPTNQIILKDSLRKAIGITKTSLAYVIKKAKEKGLISDSDYNSSKGSHDVAYTSKLSFALAETITRKSPPILS